MARHNTNSNYPMYPKQPTAPLYSPVLISKLVVNQKFQNNVSVYQEEEKGGILFSALMFAGCYHSP